MEHCIVLMFTTADFKVSLQQRASPGGKERCLYSVLFVQRGPMLSLLFCHICIYNVIMSDVHIPVNIGLFRVSTPVSTFFGFFSEGKNAQISDCSENKVSFFSFLLHLFPGCSPSL